MRTIDLELQDSLYQFGLLTQEEHTIFTIEEEKVRPYEIMDDIWMSITFERDLDLHKIDREVYSLLDFCSDIGGLFEALRLLFYLIIGLTNFFSFENFMVSALYKKRVGSRRLERAVNRTSETSNKTMGAFSDAETVYLAETENLNPKVTGAYRQICLLLTKQFCRKCPCITRSKEERYFEIGRRKFDKEIDIVRLLRAFREHKAIVRYLIKPE